MTQFKMMPTAVALLLLALSSSGAQSGEPAVREVLKTGNQHIVGVAEPASGRFIVYADEHELKIYNRQTRKVTPVAVRVTEAWGGSLSISRSGGRIVFPVSTEDPKHKPYIWSLDLDTLTGAPLGAPHRVTVTQALMAAISPDGRWIAFSAIDCECYGSGLGTRLLVMPSAGGDERMLDSAGRMQTPRWTPDGKSIFYVRGQGQGPSLRRIALGGGAHDSLESAQGVIGVSDDGKYVAFLATRSDENGVVKIADLQGRTIATVPFNGQQDRPLAWASGHAGLLALRLQEPTVLKAASLSTANISAFTVSEPSSLALRFSPDGSRLGLIGEIGDRRQFVVFDLKSGQRRVVATPQQPEASLWQWSPNGSRIAFLATNPETQRQDLNQVEIATGRTVRLADAQGIRHFRWRSDGNAIDVVQDAANPGAQTVELRRIATSGDQTVVRVLPPLSHRDERGGGYRLINDTLALIGSHTGVVAVPLARGEPRILTNHEGAWWMKDNSEPVMSPDGRWAMLGASAANGEEHSAIVSMDGKTFRLLGPPMNCDAFPLQWLPDSRSLIGLGADSCHDYHLDAFIIPIDGGPATRIALPENRGGFKLTPDGKSLVVPAISERIGSVVVFDLSKTLDGTATQSRKPASPGRP